MSAWSRRVVIAAVLALAVLLGTQLRVELASSVHAGPVDTARTLRALEDIASNTKDIAQALEAIERRMNKL